MAGNDDLFKALSMFQSGVKDLFAQRTIAGANDAVQQLRASEMDEQQKRAELQNISNQLVGQLSGLGVPATTIAQVAGTIGPKQYASPAAAAMEGVLSGDQKLVEAAGQADMAMQQGNLAQQRQQQQFMASENAKTRAHQRELAGMKTGKLQPLVDSQTTRLHAQEDTFAIGNDLMTKVKENPDLVGILAGRVPMRPQLEAEFGAFQSTLGRFFDKYRLATTGQGAGEGELKMLMTRVARETDSPETFVAKMNSYLEETNGSRKRYLGVLKKAKRDVENFSDDLTGGSSQAPAANIVEKVLANGEKVRVQRVGNKWVEVK